MTQCDSEQEKIVIAHRGASGYLPEHTLESKVLAHSMNVDFIEQDLVLSKDNVPIVIHDIFLDQVTDVKKVFPDRNRADGRYYVIDFSFEELKTLSVNERINLKTGLAVYPDRFRLYQSRFSLHSLQEEIETIQNLNRIFNKSIGIYPEIKNPGFHLQHGKDISKIVIDLLGKYGYKEKNDSCILQCFDANELKRVRTQLKSRLYLTQLMDISNGIEDLNQYAQYADAIGPSLTQIIFASNGHELVSKAHELELKIHPYTFRVEELYDFSSFEELVHKAFYEYQIDGVFSDHPDKVMEVLNR
jgi:glycerophosphoryl diester phosphodiesterase